MKDVILKKLSFSGKVEGAAFSVLSFGGGWQSTALALMAAKGLIDGQRPDHLIFADPGDETGATYKQIEWAINEVKRLCNGQIICHTVSAGNIRDDHLQGTNSTGQRFASMPLFTENGGMGKRQCTNEYKIQPVVKKIREILGLKKGQRVPKGVLVEQWLGISVDEIQRMKISKFSWLVNRWPLIEAGMSANDCYQWLKNDYPEKDFYRSACRSCPFRSNSEWLNMKNKQPEDFALAAEFDEKIRAKGTLRKMKHKQFIHSSLKPLSECSFDEAKNQISLLDECDGVCGT